jgi:hypothetical protein
VATFKTIRQMSAGMIWKGRVHVAGLLGKVKLVPPATNVVELMAALSKVSLEARSLQALAKSVLPACPYASVEKASSIDALAESPYILICCFDVRGQCAKLQTHLAGSSSGRTSFS